MAWTSTDTVFLVDYSWTAYKYYYAYSQDRFSARLPDGTTVSTGVQFGMARLVQKLLGTLPGSTIVFCLDSWDPTRRELLPEYKTGRPHGEKWDFNQVLAETNNVLSCCEGVMFVQTEGKEADDVMANFFFNLYEKKKRVCIHSNDDDMIQLCAYGAQVFAKFTKGGFVWKDEHYIREKYGVEPKVLLHYRTLCGDASDKIPPVVPRMSHQFLREFATRWQQTSFEETLEGWASFKPKYQQRIRDNKAAVVRNLKLMSLVKYKHDNHRFKSKNVTKPVRSMIADLKLFAFKGFLDKNNLWSV